MRKSRLTATIALGVATLVIASMSTAFATVPAKKHKLPKDPCALVTDEQIAALVIDAKAEPLDPTPLEVGCSWRDGKDVPTSLASFNVNVTKFTGVPIDQIKLSFNAEAHDKGSKIIKGMGGIAFQESVIPPNSEVQVLLGKILLDVEFSGDGPVTADQVAQTLAIAKAVAKKI
jgi:hypothetical protein